MVVRKVGVVGQEAEGGKGLLQRRLPFASKFGCEEEEEEEPYSEMHEHVCTLLLLVSFLPLYPTYRSCFKEFRPPIFLRISIFDTD